VTVLDANILIAAWNEDDPRNDKAMAWTESVLSREQWVGIPWVSIWAFLRILTNPRAFKHPLGSQTAFHVVQTWLDRPNVIVLQPGPRHAELLRSLVISGQATGTLLTDAVLAAIAIEYGGVLASADLDFSRFAGLSWFNPLA